MPSPNTKQITVNGMVYSVRDYIVADIERLLAPYSKTAVDENAGQAAAKPAPEKTLEPAQPTAPVKTEPQTLDGVEGGLKPAGEEEATDAGNNDGGGNTETAEGVATDEGAINDGGSTVSPDPNEPKTPPDGESG